MQFSTTAVRGASELGSVRSLHLSLNAPVIAIDELPVGPARAGVVLCTLPGGSLHLEIAIRSLRTGEVVAVASDLAPGEPAEDASAVEAALSYAEGMGFLFDEDEVGTGGSAAVDKAGSLWSDLVEDVPERARTAETAVAGALQRPSEAEDTLREVPVREFDTEAAPIAIEHAAADSEIPADALAAIPPASLLSKFRLVLPGRGRGRYRAALAAADAVAASNDAPRDSQIRLLSRY